MQKQRPFILILLALLQPLSGALAPLAGIGTPIGNATRDLGAPEQPLPVFFSIWSVIFAAYLAFALFLLLRREPWMERIAMPLAIAGLMNVVWMLSAQLIVSQPLDFALLFPIGAAAWVSAWQFDRMRGMGRPPLRLDHGGRRHFHPAYHSPFLKPRRNGPAMADAVGHACARRARHMGLYAFRQPQPLVLRRPRLGPAWHPSQQLDDHGHELARHHDWRGYCHRPFSAANARRPWRCAGRLTLE